MYQSYKSPNQSRTSIHAPQERLSALRKEMTRAEINWYLVPHADEQQNEYLPKCAERLAWLTGFTGSAGFALVGHEKAYLFVDGRYTLQAQQQADRAVWQIIDLIDNPPVKFARQVLKQGTRIGFDPGLITLNQEKHWRDVCEETASRLAPSDNLIDIIWENRPNPPLGQAWLHPVGFAGQKAEDKLQKLKAILKEDGADHLLVTDPASVAWTFNLRGSDIVHNPLTLAYAIVSRDDNKPILFIDRRKLDEQTETALELICQLSPPASLDEEVARFARRATFHCDPNLVSIRLGTIIEKNGGSIVRKPDPVSLLRAVKNEIELTGARNAHLRDGVAMVRFLTWLDQQPAGSVDEITASKKLETLRVNTAREMDSELREISFDTISGAGANGAIIHYRVNEGTNAPLSDNALYLVDSGGQYEDGTTDITRTIAIGKPPGEAITDYTLVLKGHIAIATARFPKGTRGVDLDPLARTALWQAGKDFAHGTGHGVGSYLNVHEGPQSISKRGMQALLPGMIISNEPGYYKQGAYGIRLENLVIVEPPRPIKDGDTPMLGFETITLSPFDRRLINTGLLSDAERYWLNQYHAHVLEKLSPHLEDDDLAWLEAACAAL